VERKTAISIRSNRRCYLCTYGDIAVIYLRQMLMLYINACLSRRKNGIRRVSTCKCARAEHIVSPSHELFIICVNVSFYLRKVKIIHDIIRRVINRIDKKVRARKKEFLFHSAFLNISVTTDIKLFTLTALDYFFFFNN